MDHAVAVLRGEAQPTVQDIISWIEEEAFRMGSLGFRHGYSNPSDIFSKFSMSSSVGDLDEWDRLENCATTAMRGIHDEIISMQRRMQIMKAHRGGIHDEIASREQHRMQVMNANAPLLARTEAWVNCELRKAGKSQADIDGYSKSQGRLREKVLDLYNLKHPHLDPPAGVPAVLYLGPKFERKVKVGLPIKASLAEVCELLDRVCASDDYLSLGWHEPSTLTGEGKKIWKYHLVDQEQMKLIRPDSTRLLSDADYNHLIRQFKRKRGVYSRYAVLTAVSMSFKHSKTLLISKTRTCPR